MTAAVLNVEFSPTTGPFDTPVWISLSSGPHGNRILSADWNDGKQADFDDFPPGEATIVLSNDDRLFDPEHASGTYYGDLNPRVPFRIRATYSATTYDLFYGFVEDGWEQHLDPPADSTCTVKLVDMLTILSQYTLPSMLELGILADDPVAYWPLDETAGTVLHDRVGSFSGRYTAGSTSLSTEQETLEGATVRGIEWDGEHYAYAESNVPPALTRPFVVEALVNPTLSSDSSDWGPFFVMGNGNQGQSFIFFAANPYNGAPFQGILGGVTNGSVPSTERATGAAIWVTYRIPAAGSPSIYENGVNVSDTRSTISNEDSFSGVSMATYKNSILGTKRFAGFVAHVTVYDYDIGTTRIAAHAEAATAPLDELRSDEQIAWILDTIGIPASMYDLDTGVATMPPLDSKGRNALELAREIAHTEWGGFYVDHSNGGKLRLRQRYASWLDTRATTPQATFSDDPAAVDGTVARVEPGTLQVEANGVSSIINQVSVNWRGGTEVVDQSAGSVYGPRPISVDSQVGSPDEARGLGEWIAGLNVTPKAKIRSLGIDPAAVNEYFPIALGTRIGDRAAYRIHPQSVGSATTQQLEVLGRHHSVVGVNWSTDFYLTSAPGDPDSGGVALFLWDSSLLDGPDVLAH